MNSVIQETLNATQIERSFSTFMHTFRIASLFHQCRIEKKRGIPTPHLFAFVFLLIFTGKNLYRYFHPVSSWGRKQEKKNHAPSAFGDDTVYRFLQEATFHWKKFLLLLSKRIIQQFVQPLSSLERVRVLIVDDTLLPRERSKNVELLSSHFDHTNHRMVKGFNLLTLGYDDGATFLPLEVRMMCSSRHYANPLESSQWKHTLHPSSLAYRLRENSLLKKPEAVEEMLKQVLKQGIQASYVLFDSWFSVNSSLIKRIQREMGLGVITMLKRSKAYYGYQQHLFSLEALYALCSKKGQAPIEVPAGSKGSSSRILGSMVVSLGNRMQGAGKQKQEEDFQVKIVFVQNRNKKSKRAWLALLSTDISLGEEEIVRIYGRRWNIEVFFKSMKSLLKVEKEYQLRSFDSIHAHITIVCCRYCYLSWLSRLQKDPRSLGDLFYQTWEEIEDIKLWEAMDRILKWLLEYLKIAFPQMAEKLQELFTLFVRSLPCYILQSLDIIICGS